MLRFLGVVAAGVIGFVALFLYAVVGVIVLALSAFSGLCLLLALLSLTVWLGLGTGHSSALSAMGGFLAWGSVGFTMITVATYGHERLLALQWRSTGTPVARPPGRANLQGPDASFDS
jgi:hypothetical protein